MFLTIVQFSLHNSPKPASWIYGEHTCKGEGRDGKEKTWGGGEEMEGGKERGVYRPFPTFSAVTSRHDNKLNENHRLDSDLSTYNKLGGITLCITEMAILKLPCKGVFPIRRNAIRRN